MSFKVSDYINLAKRKLHFKGVINEGQVQNGIFFFFETTFCSDSGTSGSSLVGG